MYSKFCHDFPPCDVDIINTTSVQFHLSMRIFSKGSHPVSFRSFSCRLPYIGHDDDGLHVLLSFSVRGIIKKFKKFEQIIQVNCLQNRMMHMCSRGKYKNIQMLKYG